MEPVWKDEAEDVRACFEIIKRDCPDGKMGTLILNSDEEKNPDDPDNPFFRIHLNPTLCKILIYFKDKYPENGLENGLVLSQEFVSKYIFRGAVAPVN